MKLKVKKLNELARLPVKGTPYSAGYDVYATSKEIKEDGRIVYGTGIAVQVESESNTVVKLYPRSSMSKLNMVLANHVGIVDADYRGELFFVFRDLVTNNEQNHYQVGDRIGQLIVEYLPSISVCEVSELSHTMRGDGGFGSTGN